MVTLHCQHLLLMITSSVITLHLAITGMPHNYKALLPSFFMTYILVSLLSMEL